MYRKYIKPVFDRIVSFLLLIVLSPILLLLTILLSIANKGGPFFTQRRPGRNEKPFRLVKFKTMSEERDKKGTLLSDKDRLTRIGKFMRKTSLDELPQLFNVVKGDMSFVGPRPLLMEYLPLYSARQRKRHDVKPGITGWAQVNGRNTLSWEDKFKYDVWYVENQSFRLDMKILWLTFIKVLKAEGISGRYSATMEKFKGNER